MNKIVLDIEQMCHLQKLGLDCSDASMYWLKRCDEEFYHLAVVSQSPAKLSDDEYYAYTLQDMLYKLPNSIYAPAYRRRYYLMVQSNIRVAFGVHYSCDDQWLKVFEGNYDSLIDTVYEMLCWCIDNKQIKI